MTGLRVTGLRWVGWWVDLFFCDFVQYFLCFFKMYIMIFMIFYVID